MDEEQIQEAQSKNYPLSSVASDNKMDGDDEGFIDAPNDQSGFSTGLGESKEKIKSRARKLTSSVWNYFEKVEVSGVTKARCNSCKKLLSANSSHGTSHLKKHALESCAMKQLHLGTNVDDQSKLRVTTELDGSSTLDLKEKYKVFNQEFSRTKLVNMVVIHEYPLAIVDHFAFREFIQSLNPHFKIVSRNTLKSDILKMYMDDKLSLQRLLLYNDGRIAITTDMWTASNQKKGYMVVTAHFIDENWVLRNRTLRFCFVPCPHTKGVLAKVLMDCLSQYGLESKISSIVVDNCTTNDAMMKIILRNFVKKNLLLEGAFLHLRCSAHILNLVVRDGLDVIESAIAKVRDCVSFWMSTPKRIENFEEARRHSCNSCSKSLVLDCKTRWNSTFYMLQSALPYVDVFERLKRLNGRLKFDIPSMEDWELARIMCDKLEIFDKTTKVFSGRHFFLPTHHSHLAIPTSNVFFRKACTIKIKLREWLNDDVDIVKFMARNMIEKFDKYWEHVNGLLAIAAILDPRNKMDCIEHYFRRLYGDDAVKEVERVRKMLDDLVVEYQQRSEENKNEEETFKGNGKRMNSSSYDEDDDDEYARIKKTKKRKVIVKSEVDYYLDDLPEEENDKFDILNWGKADSRYPTLKKIAKDILAIPISSVASESAFSMGGRVVSAHRSRLTSNTVEALMCLQNWKTQARQGDFDDKIAYATVNEDIDLEDNFIDALDMDVDDIPIDDM